MEDLNAAVASGNIKLTFVQEVSWRAILFTCQRLSDLLYFSRSAYVITMVCCVLLFFEFLFHLTSLDINDRMPRQEAAEIFIKIKELGLVTTSNRDVA